MSTPARYPIPARIHRVEETIQRSRFVTTVAHAPDADAAHAFVGRVREELPDATHHCWAFVAGPPGSTTHIGMSDDGEPHGTAGRPMLTTLLHGGVGEIVAVCTRYYGGVKLGTGGLGRAYAGGVKLALEAIPTEERVERVSLSLIVGYAHVDALQRLFEELDVVVEGETYGVDVRYDCAVPAPAVGVFEGAVADLSRGEGRVERDG
ncbi:MAG: YigZ family protein [Gemmatimonadota bacterium]